MVFNEKMKVNAVFLRDSTAVSDSAVLLFGGDVSKGGLVSSCFLHWLYLSVIQLSVSYGFLSSLFFIY